MVRLHDIMALDVITVSPETTLRAAAGVLADENVSGAPVVAGSRVVGVVSASDIVEFVAGQPGVPTDRPHMDEPGEWPDAEPWAESDDPPAAYFTDFWSDAGADVDARMDATQGPEWNALEEHTVSEVMTRSITSLDRDASVRDAAELMLKAHVHRVLVLEDGELVGLVSATDILKAVSQHGIAG